jgi:hypothetical protein
MLLHPLDMIGLPLPPAWADALGWGLATLPLTPLAVAAGAGILAKMLSSQGLKVGNLPLLFSSLSVFQALTLIHPTSKWFEKQQFISPSPWESPVRYPQNYLKTLDHVSGNKNNQSFLLGRFYIRRQFKFV